MKKLLLAIAILLTFNSCKKNVAVPDVNSTAIQTKVTAWLDAQKLNMADSEKSKVDAWSKDLSFDKTKFEAYDNGEKIVVIPLEGDYSKNNNLAGNIISNVVLILDNAGNIRSGNIVLYQPKDDGPSGKLTEHAFYDVFNTAEPKCNGQFEFLRVDGKLRYQLAYNNGAMISFGEVKPESALNIANPAAKKVCIDWYLVTTYYYSDGTTQTTQEYITTSCNDTQSFLQDPAGGGLEFAVTKYTDWWTVYKFPVGEVLSQEKFTGKRNRTEPGGGHFTSGAHSGSTCNLTNGLWAQGNVTIQIDGAFAHATISGRWTWNSDHTFINISGKNDWGFGLLFP